MSFVSDKQAQQAQNNQSSGKKSGSQSRQNTTPYYYLAPLNGFDVKDMTELVRGINEQLTILGKDIGSLSQSTATPVNGNLFASVSATGNLIKHLNNPDTKDYTPLSLDLLGCLTEAGSNDANLVTILRPILHKVRDAYLRQPKEDKGKNPLKASDITLFNDHMHTLNAGELKKAVEVAQSNLSGWLDRAATLAKTSLDSLVLPPPSPTNPVPQLPDPMASKGNQNWYEPAKTHQNLWQALQNISGKKAVAPIPRVPNPELAKNITALQATLAKQIKAQSGTKEMQIGFLLQKLNEALKNNGEVLKTTAIVEGQPARVIEEKKEGVFEALASVNATEDCSNSCKDGTCSGSATPYSIGYALGEERIYQSDFSLPGVMPLTWHRVYRSNLITYDKGALGARWTNSYLSRIDIRKNEWLLNTSDGRIVKLPKLKVGEFHRDGTNGYNIAYLSVGLISITFGHDQIQLFQKQGNKHYKLYMVRDRNGNSIELHYDKQYRLVLIDNHTDKHSLSFKYNQNKQIEAVYLHHSNPETIIGDQIRIVAQYQYDQRGNLIAATDEYQDTRAFEYDDHHRITRYSDRTDFGINLEWQGRRHKAKAIREYADDGSRESKLDWLNGLRCTIVVNALGQTMQSFSDISGYPVRRIYPSGREEWYFRDSNKNIIKQINPDGRATGFGYDWQSNLLSITENDSSKTFFEYNDKDLLIKSTDANGHQWRNEYDPKGNLSKAIDPKGYTTEYQYNDQGLPIAIIDPKGGVNKFEYNQAGQLIKQTDCSAKSIEYQYNNKGQLLSSKDTLGHEVQHKYNDKGQLQKTAYPDGQFITYQYDAEGRLLSSKDQLGREYRTEYDEGYYPYGSIDPLGRQTKVRPDKIGKPLQLTDANGAIYSWQYDPITNEITKETNFAGKTTQYQYDEQTGELIQKLEQNGIPVQYEYDEMGRISRLYTDNLNHQFMYDQMGQLIQAQNAYSKNQYFYDRTGNLIKEVQEITRLGESDPENKYIKRYIWYHEYDVLGNRTITIRPDGQRIDYLTYGSGHIHGMLLNQQPLVDFERDDIHREVSRTFANKIEHKYTFDKQGYFKQFDLKGEYNAQSKQQISNGKEYRYNKQGLISEIFDQNRGKQAYEYDLVGRLIHSKNIDYDEHFQYDSANNLLDPLNSSIKATENYAGNYDLQGKFRDKITETDYLNQIDKKTGLPKIMGNLTQKFNGSQYRYDQRGNLIQKSDHTGVTSYEWNDLNQLTKLITAKGITYYRYDTFGRRIYKQTPDGKETYSIWDGDLMVMEETPSHIRHFIYEPDSFAPLAQFDTNAENNPVQVYFYHNDHLGTPELMSDEAGELVWLGTKTAYGQMYEQTSAMAKLNNVSNPIRFQGQYFDEESGLHYNRYRYYDPETGRYLSEDPIKLAGGMNLYGYPRDPVEWIDPLGLEEYKRPWHHKVIGDNLPQIPQPVTNAVTGFGDGVCAGVSLGACDLNETRKALNISGGVDTDSATYNISKVGGTVYVGLIPMAPKGVVLGSRTQKVAHWTPKNCKGCNTLKPGDWVMTGSHKNAINYELSGVRQLGYPKGTGFSKTVPKSDLSWPKGWEKVKGTFGQRIYTPK